MLKTFFLNAVLFLKQFWIDRKIEQNVQRFPMPPNMHSLPIINISCWNNETTLIYQYHPKSTAFTLGFKEVINFNMFYLTQCIQNIIIQHIIYIKINDIFYILGFFLYHIFETWCVFNIRLSLSVDQPAFKCSVGRCSYWLQYRTVQIKMVNIMKADIVTFLYI